MNNCIKLEFKKSVIFLTIIFSLLTSLLIYEYTEDYETSENLKASSLICSLEKLTQAINIISHYIENSSTLKKELIKGTFSGLLTPPSDFYPLANSGDISSIYFISKDNFIISWPTDFSEHTNNEKFNSIIESRPYWINTIRYGMKNKKNRVVYTGEYDDYLTGKKVITLTKGIYVNDKFKGIIAIDSYVSKLFPDNEESYKIISTLGGGRYEITQKKDSKPLFVNNKTTNLHLVRDEEDFSVLLYSIKKNLQKIYYILTLFLFCLFIIWLNYTKKKRKILSQAAMRDPLTRLFNRRGFEDRLVTQQVEPIIGVGVFDIDDLQALCDSYGSGVKNKVICHVSHLIVSCVRQHDLVARFNDDKFIVVILGESFELLNSIFERIQSDISLQSYRSSNYERIKISVSGGVALYSLYEFDNVASFWKTEGTRVANNQLYKAQKFGNKICIRSIKRFT